jgi:mono/diheme cytochrome c family protein
MTTLLLTRFGLLAFVLLLVASCSPAATPAPTVPPFTQIPTFRYVAPTAPPPVATAAATVTVNQSSTALDPARVERGRGRYVALNCGSCHGENGEGTDQASALVGTTLSEGEFVSFLRSGGGMGNEHLFSTNVLSDAGGRNLYQYILSLSAEASQ